MCQRASLSPASSASAPLLVKNTRFGLGPGANFEIFDLGTNVSVDKFMAAAREHKADIIGISALLTTTMGGMRGVIEAVRAADDLPNLPVMVGGAAVTKEFAETIGADGWAPDAGSAVILARRLVAEARAARAAAGVEVA